MVDGRKTRSWPTPCGIIRVTALCDLCRYRHKSHWTGHASRLDRNLKNRFGSAAYAAEELIAEMGSAFLCADLGIASEVREDHTAYLACWLDVMKADSRAIFAAASQAQRAADYLHKLQDGQPADQA